MLLTELRREARAETIGTALREMRPAVGRGDRYAILTSDGDNQVPARSFLVEASSKTDSNLALLNKAPGTLVTIAVKEPEDGERLVTGRVDDYVLVTAAAGLNERMQLAGSLLGTFTCMGATALCLAELSSAQPRPVALATLAFVFFQGVISAIGFRPPIRRGTDWARHTVDAALTGHREEARIKVAEPVQQASMSLPLPVSGPFAIVKQPVAVGR